MLLSWCMYLFRSNVLTFLLSVIALCAIGPSKPPLPVFPPADLWPELETAPPAGDWCRFPPKDAVSVARRLNSAFRANMEVERHAWPLSFGWRFDEAIRYSELAYKCWDCLDDALMEWREPWQRQLSMKKLRGLLGEEAYMAGEMPPCVPVWMFRQLK